MITIMLNHMRSYCMKTINVLVDCDSNYVYPTATMMYSLKKNTRKDTSINYYFPYYEDNQLSNIELNILKKQLRPNDSFKEILCEKLFDERLFTRWSSQIMLKYIVLYHLPDEVARIFRLDSDVIVNGDVSPFYQSELLRGGVALGTKECFNEQIRRNAKLGVKDNLTINAGVCLINVEFWKKRLPSVEEFKKQFEILSDKILPAAEQNFLNLFFDGQKKYWPTDKYMRICLIYLVMDLDYRDKRPVIYHYLSENKPWLYYGMPDHRMLYWKYAVKVFPMKYTLVVFFKRIPWLVNHYYIACLRRLRRII